MIESLLDLIKSNTLLTAGIGTVAFGSLMYVVKSVPFLLYRMAKRLLTVELVLPSENHLYHDVMEVLSRNRVRAFARLFTISTRGGVIAGYGTSLAVWRGRLVVFTRSIVEKEFHLTEKVELTLLSRRVDLLEELVHLAKQPPIEPAIKVYQGGGGYFGDHVRKAKRSLATVFCAGDAIAEVRDRIDWFLANEQWYLARGIPYKLVFLFHGRPGGGKSSLIFALASEYSRNLCAIGSVFQLARTFANAPENSFLVIEDIDMLAVSRQGDGEKAAEGQGGAPTPAQTPQDQRETAIGLSALHVLINTLDGLATPHGMIVFITTNHKEKLDDALVRSGRIDHDKEIGPLDAEATGAMFAAFYGASSCGIIEPYLVSREFVPRVGSQSRRWHDEPKVGRMPPTPRRIPMSLAGKFFFHCGKEYTQTGEVIEQTSVDTVLVKFDHCEHVPQTMTLLPVSAMISKIKPDGSIDGNWELFATREQLDVWLAWLDSPSPHGDENHRDAGPEETPKLN